MKDFFLRLCIPSLLFLGLTGSFTARAETEIQAESRTEPKAESKASQDTPFKFSGFGTLGVTYNTSRDFDYIRDLLQTTGVGASRRIDLGLDSLLGLQLSAPIIDNLEATAQVVARRSYRGFRPELSWLFVKYSPDDNLDLRGGRLGFDVYPLADSRNVGYSYLWVRPPVDYFGNLIISYIDGADAVYKFNTETTQTKIKFFSGQAQEQVLVDAPDNFFSLKGSRIFGGHLEFQSQHWLARVGLTNLRFKNELPSLLPLFAALNSLELIAINPSLPQLAHDLSFKEKRVRYLSAGLVYDQGPLQAQLMYSRLKSESLGFNSNQSAFITVGYRHKEWTPYVTLAKTKPIDYRALGNSLPSGTNVQFDQINAAVQSVSSSTLSEQNTQSLGLRYSLSNSSDIKVQFDHLDVTQRGLVRATTAAWNGKANIITCTFNFIFN